MSIDLAAFAPKAPALPFMSPRTRARIFHLAVLVVVAGALSLYAWISSQSAVYADFTRDYTERLASGKADLSLRPSSRILTLADPYDPKLNAGAVLDASLYRGHYYVYFGITPFITLLVPWFLVTGHHLGEPAAVALYACGGFLLATATLLLARRKYFPDGGRFASVMAVLLVGFASPVVLVVRRPAIYELVIACAWFYFALALCCAFQAMHAERRRGAWLFFASVSMGLSVGSRASYALGAIFFLVWAWLLTTRRYSHVFSRRQWMLGVLAPLAAVGAGLASFNWLRFGNPLEFGFNYQINELDRSRVVFWGFRNFGFNLDQYLFRPWRLGGYFPFFLGERSGPLSTLENYGRTEFLYGFLATVPLLALVAAAPWALRGLAKLRMLALLAAGVSLLNLFALVGLINGSYRYQVDAVPGLLLVLGWTILALFGSSLLVGKARVLAQAVTASLVAISCLAVFFSQFALLDVYEAYHPDDYGRMARLFNQPVFWGQSLVHYHPTEPVVTVKLPTDKFGHVEPLLVVGENTLQDFLYLYYTAPSLLQVGFESIGHGGPVSPPLAVDYGRPHTFEIFYGSFVPPQGHPLLAELTPDEAALLRRTLVVRLDGRVILDGWDDFHKTKDLFYWGESPDDPAFGRRFSGEILSRSTAALPTDPSPGRNQYSAYGGMHVLANVSTVHVGSRAPLLTAGYANQGALVYVERLGPDSIQLGMLASGTPPEVGPALQLDPTVPHAVEIIFGSLLPPATSPAWSDSITPERRVRLKRQVLVRVDGRTALRAAEDMPEAAPSTIAAGQNGVGFSGVDPVFGDGLTLQMRDSLDASVDELARDGATPR
jgi:hypothetical protein